MTHCTPDMAVRPCGPCHVVSDNKFFNRPARMSDGRLFTDYRPRCDVNYKLDPQGNTMDSYSYRQYLIANTDVLLRQLRGKAKKDAGPCKASRPSHTMLPESETDVCNTRACVRRPVHMDGLGLGRSVEWDADAVIPDLYAGGQEDDDLRNCCTQPEDDAAYFPVANMEAQIRESIRRTATPYGGVPLTGGDASYVSPIQCSQNM